MVSISLGGFSTINGKNVLFGVGGSGLDTNSLISGLLQAKAIPANILQQQISKGDKVVSALGQFQQLLSTFKSAANALRNPPGGSLNAADNGFAYNSVSVSSNTSVDASTYLSITASPGATLQDFDITYITSLAKATKQSSETFTIADADTAGLVVASGAAGSQFNAGTITIAPGSTIEFTTADTLNSIAAKFNNITSSTKIAASVVKIEDGEFVLSFTGVVTGTDDAFDLDDVGTVTSDPSGVLGVMDFTDNQLASDAVFKLDGQTITRSTNTISDAISGVTIRLLKVTPETAPTPSTTLTASVEADVNTAKSSAIAFFNAYNALKEFAAKQTKLKTDGTYDDSAVLANNLLFRNTVDNIVSQVISVVRGVAGGDPTMLSDVGITLIDSPATTSTPEVRNVITIDETTFTAALQSDYNAVRNLFEFDFNTDSTNLRVFRRTNALDTTAFTLNVNPFATQAISGIDVVDADTQIVFTSPTDGQLGAGPITVNGETITLTDGMTLNQVVTAVNAAEGNSGLHAALTGSSGSYTLTFTATRQTGKANLFDLTATTQDAANAVFGDMEITATGTYAATYDNGAGDITVDLDGTVITGGGGFLLKGQSGTVLEGLQMIYGSQSAEESDVTLSQGIADKVYNTLEGLLNVSTGSLKAEYDSIQEKEDDLTARIEKITEQVTKFRDELLAKFAALEAAISSLNSLLQSLDAQEKARQQFAS